MKVELITTNGDADLLAANAARVSFGKRKTELEPEDAKLIKYLAKHKHMSPFRHPQLTIHITCSDTVARQFYKHAVGGSYAFKDVPWNEISGRYIEYTDFDCPPLRKQAANVKQGSSDELVGQTAQFIYEGAIVYAERAYKQLLELGVCREQARMVLPFATETQFWVTGSLEYWFHLVQLRKESHAQKEIQIVANEIEEICKVAAPVAWAALSENV
jgi:thymidylate synthase (FAD)